MLPQQVAPEIPVKITPYGMHVIPVVLRIVVFDEERRTLNSIVMLLSALCFAGPSESDLIDPGFLDFGAPVSGDVVRHF